MWVFADHKCLVNSTRALFSLSFQYVRVLKQRRAPMCGRALWDGHSHSAIFPTFDFSCNNIISYTTFVTHSVNCLASFFWRVAPTLGPWFSRGLGTMSLGAERFENWAPLFCFFLHCLALQQFIFVYFSTSHCTSNFFFSLNYRAQIVLKSPSGLLCVSFFYAHWLVFVCKFGTCSVALVTMGHDCVRSCSVVPIKCNKMFRAFCLLLNPRTGGVSVCAAVEPHYSAHAHVYSESLATAN